MSDERTGRELTPRAEGGEIQAREGRASVERFEAGAGAHRVGLTEERAAKIVRQTGNARSIGFLVVLLLALFIPLYWFYDQGVPLVADTSRLAKDATTQQIQDVSEGYKLFLANCSQCHGAQGQGGVGPPLNNQDKLYNAVTATGLSGPGHLNPIYIKTVLIEGGRYVCGDAKSVMPVWSDTNGGPLNYRQIDDLVAFITASKDLSWQYQPDPSPGQTAPPPVTVEGWRDPAYKPDPAKPTPPACWRNPSGAIGGGGAAPSSSPGTITNPGTAANPRQIDLTATADLHYTDASGQPLSSIPLKAGEAVKFVITNSAGFDHNFYIGAATDLQAGNTASLTGLPAFSSGTQSLTYSVPSAGQLQFACTLPGHYQTMHGDLTIIP